MKPFKGGDKPTESAIKTSGISVEVLPFHRSVEQDYSETFPHPFFNRYEQTPEAVTLSVLTIQYTAT